jgi:tRNA U34 5-methylaminomethyl-2-thiouridine-forming methyltransferase MnmC
MKTQLVTTSDGSHTLFVPEIDEHYHSVNGAIQESRHIFINAALNQCTKTDIHVLEIGFGTGLNAFLSLLEAEKTNKKILFTTIELYPIAQENVGLFNYAEQIDPARKSDFEQLHIAEWNKRVFINEHFTLEKILADFTSFQFNNRYDVIFFDAFSPEKQPEMWQEEIFSRLYDISNNDCILTTYCAKGAVRRAMQQAGYVVERIAGPKGKREILRCRKTIL